MTKCKERVEWPVKLLTLYARGKVINPDDKAEFSNPWDVRFSRNLWVGTFSGSPPPPLRCAEGPAMLDAEDKTARPPADTATAVPRHKVSFPDNEMPPVIMTWQQAASDGGIDHGSGDASSGGRLRHGKKSVLHDTGNLFK